MKPLFTTLPMALLASCGGSATPEVSVRDAWSRPTLTPTQPAAVYLKIVNSGGAPDRLKGVASDGGRPSLHNSVVENGVVRMRPIPDGLALSAGSTVELKPHGMHIMLEDLREPLKAGTSYSLTLQFEKAGDRQVRVQVAEGPGESHDGH